MNRATRGRRLVLVAVLTAMLVIHNLQRTSFVSIFTGMHLRFNVNYAGVGLLFAAYVLGYAIAQAIVAAVGDRFNARSLLLMGLALSVLLAVVFAVTRSFEVALVARLFLGATGALLYTPAIELSIILFEPSDRGWVMGILQSGAGFGAVMALILIPVIATRLGITGALLTLPAVSTVVLLAAIGTLPASPRKESLVRIADPRTRMGRRADFWQLLFISFTGMLAMYGLLTWLPTYLTQSFGYSSVRAGVLSSIPNIAMVVTAPLIGKLVDLSGGRTPVVAGGSFLAFGCYLFLIPGPSVLMVSILSAFAGISLAATTAPLMLFAGERFEFGETARVVALMATTAQIGATLAGVLFGLALSLDNGFRIIWITCAALALIRAVMFVAVFGRRPISAHHT